MFQAQPAYLSDGQFRSNQPSVRVATRPAPPASVDRILPLPSEIAMCPYPREPPVQYTAAPRGGFRSLRFFWFAFRQAVEASG